MTQLSLKFVSSFEFSKLVAAFNQRAGSILERSKAVIQAQRHRSAVNQLAHLDDYILRDIGLTRSDVIAALEQPIAADPSLDLTKRRTARRQAKIDLLREIKAEWSDPFAR